MERRGDCGPLLPVAEEGGAQLPQRSKNRRVGVSPTGSSGTARWCAGAATWPARRRANLRSHCAASFVSLAAIF